MVKEEITIFKIAPFAKMTKKREKRKS